MEKLRCVRFSFLVAVTCYLVSTAIAQHQISTDPARCCKRLPNSTQSDSTCKPTKLTATQFQQAITTPNYPKAFEVDTFCIWEVYALAGRRILLEFRNIHLVPKDDDECFSQKLIVRSPLTGMEMGPFCGHDGLPSVVTTGNYIVVELQSPNPTQGRDYKGFQMVYTETVQATSIGLRPPNWSDGMYLEYQTPKTQTKPSRYKPTRRTNYAPSTTTAWKPKSQNPNRQKEPGKKKTPKEKNRVTSNSNNLRNIVPLRPYFPPPRIPTRIREKSNKDTMGTEIIVAIVVGGIVVIAVISVVVAKLSYRTARRRRKREEEEEARRRQSSLTPVQRTTQLPSTWRPVVQSDTRPNYLNSQSKVAHVNEYMTHRSAKYRSDSRSKETVPDSRERSRRSNREETYRRDKPPDPKRRPQNRAVRKSNAEDKHSKLSRGRNDSGKKAKRRSDR